MIAKYVKSLLQLLNTLRKEQNHKTQERKATMENTEAIAKLFELKKQGALTEEEFNHEKAKLLGTAVKSPELPQKDRVITPQEQAQVDDYKALQEKASKSKACGRVHRCFLGITFLIIIGSCFGLFKNPDVTERPNEVFRLLLAASFLMFAGLCIIYLLRGDTRRAARKEADLLCDQLNRFPQTTKDLVEKPIVVKGSSADTGWFYSITNPTPLWVAFLVNLLAWTVFVMTMNHVVEFLMGVACVYVGLVAVSKRTERNATWLIYVSFVDALWMFYWAFSKPMRFNF